MKEIKFIDLFAGIGGFRYSLTKCGCKCVFSSEINEACQTVYLKNYGERTFGDITQIDPTTIPDFDILCAGFPCQPFSICGKKKGFDDVRGTLFFDICRIINEKKPSVVFLENVKHLINHDHKRTFQTICKKLEDLGYHVKYRVLNSRDFGVPQSRERLIIIATQKGYFNFDKLKKKPTVLLKDILEKDGDFEYLSPNEYTLLDKHLIKVQPDTGLIFCGYRNKGLWKKGIRPGTEYLSRCHRQPNRIYSANGIHPTIPSQETSGRFWIYVPDENKVRKLTIKECYRLMGYPENFIIDENKGNAYKQIGNSVVIPMITELAKQIINQCFEEEKNAAQSDTDTAEFGNNLCQFAFNF